MNGPVIHWPNYQTRVISYKKLEAAAFMILATAFVILLSFAFGYRQGKADVLDSLKTFQETGLKKHRGNLNG